MQVLFKVGSHMRKYSTHLIFIHCANFKEIVHCIVKRNAGLVEVKQSSFTLRTNFTIGLICVRNKKSWTESNELCFYKATLNSHNRLFLLFLAAWMHYRGEGVSTHLVETSLFGGSNSPSTHNTPTPWLMRIHFTRISLTLLFKKNPDICT